MLLLRSAAAAAGHDKAVRYANGDRQDDDVASIDHIIPRSEGGRLGFNAVVAHRRRNAERNRRPITPAETARLAALNERRRHAFFKGAGATSPTEFGIESNASVALAAALNALEDAEETTQGARWTLARVHGDSEPAAFDEDLPF